MMTLHRLRCQMLLLFCVLFSGLSVQFARGNDEVELLSGARLQGTIIERTEQTVRIQVMVDNRQLIRSYPLNRVRAITQKGVRQVLVPESAASSGTTNAPAVLLSGDGEMIQRAPEAIEALIEQIGRTPPEWLASTPLDYPNTLDLTWPEPPPAVWNFTRNVDHYLWDVINVSPSRYRSGVRLMHHLLEVNSQNERTRARVMNELGRMFFEFFKDYARAAYWWRQAKVDQDPKFLRTASPAYLAECYWRLGSRPMAVQLLDRLPLTLAVIKLWGDLKETQRALALVEQGLQQGFSRTETFLIAGDVCRAAKDFAQATEFYQKVLAVPANATGAQAQQIKRDQDRARATLEVIRLFDTLDVSRIPDGSYSGKSLGYSGNVEVEAVVKGGRIEAINVIQNSDRQYYHAVETTIRRILSRQTVHGVDAISGATFTSEAVIRASAKALADGMKTNSAAK